MSIISPIFLHLSQLLPWKRHCKGVHPLTWRPPLTCLEPPLSCFHFSHQLTDHREKNPSDFSQIAAEKVSLFFFISLPPPHPEHYVPWGEGRRFFKLHFHFREQQIGMGRDFLGRFFSDSQQEREEKLNTRCPVKAL